MIDMTAILRDYLAADIEVADVVDVYADIIPENPAYPLALVRTIEVTEPAPPLSTWERHDMQIDVVGLPTGFADLVAAVTSIRYRLEGFHGAVSGIAIAGSDVVATTRTVDESVSPARPRWVLAVEVTARSI